MYEFIAPLIPELHKILIDNGAILTADEQMRVLISAADVERARHIIQTLCPTLGTADYDFRPIE